MSLNGVEGSAGMVSGHGDRNSRARLLSRREQRRVHLNRLVFLGTTGGLWTYAVWP